MTNLWLALNLPRLALDALLPEQHEQALAVVDQRQRIICLNAAAQQQGLQTGLLLNSAQAICPHLRVLPQQHHHETAALQSLACWAWQFSSRIHLEPPDELVLEIGGSLQLFAGLASFIQTWEQALQQQHYDIFYAIAPTVRGAQILARTGKNPVYTEWNTFHADCRQLPIPMMRWPAKIEQKLHAIGVDRLGPCQDLPRDGFIKRYGKLARQQLDQVWGLCADPRSQFTPPETYHRKLDLLAESDNLNNLLPGFERLFQDLKYQLQSSGSALSVIEIFLSHGSDPDTRLQLNLQSPSRDDGHWLSLLSHRFERLQLQDAVRTIGVHAKNFIRLGHQQDQLWAEADQQQAQQLMEELSARLGTDCLYAVRSYASHCPEQAWQRTDPGQGCDEAPQTRQRPLWLYPQAIPVAAQKLHDFEGPERLETGWWEAHCRRDYFRARDDQGRLLWVYRDHRAPEQWFLHGLFA